MRRLLRTTLWILIPLLAATVAAQATPIFGSVTFTCGDSYTTTCVAGLTGGGTSSGGGVTLTTSESATGWTSGSNNTLTWSGTGSGSFTSNSMPVSWDFTIAPYGGPVQFQWDLEVILGGTTVYNSGMSAPFSTGTQVSIGNSTMNLGSLTTLGSWEAVLLVSFVPGTTGNGVTVTSAGTGIDLGPVPEPSTWGMAGGGLLFALTMATRKLRRG